MPDLDPALIFMIEALALWGGVQRFSAKVIRTARWNTQISDFTRRRIRYAVYIIRKKKPKRCIDDEVNRIYIYRLEAIELYEHFERNVTNIENILNADPEIYKITKVRILQLGKKILREYRPDFCYRWRVE